MSAPVLSWPLIALGTPGAPGLTPAHHIALLAPQHLAMQSTSTTLAGSRYAPRSSGVSTRIPRPSPQSQSFSRSYGSILPTSLTYIVLSTRGFSPWRPAAVMSTAGYENHSLPRIFTGRQERTGHNKRCCAFPDIKPYLQAICFQGGSLLKRKENSFQGPCRRLRVRLRCRRKISIHIPVQEY